MMFKKRVVVFGAGPAGLIAAQAAEDAGREVFVFTAPDARGNPRKSELHGCQYLHAPIPRFSRDASGPQRLVRYHLKGSSEDYRRKVYGDNWDGEVSPDEYGPEQDHYAWDLRDTYDRLWGAWFSRITAMDLSPRMAGGLSEVRGQISLCTVPAPALCLHPDEHKFVSQGIWAMGSRVPSGNETPENYLPYRAPDMTVECNAEVAPRWYRAATVFGHSTIEWPAGPKPPISGVVAVNKPLSTDCTCHGRPTWHRIGRYGEWRKGVLTHSVYERVRGLLK